MAGGGGERQLPSQPSNGGEFLLSLLHKPYQPQTSASTSRDFQPPQSVNLDPAVAAVGPTLPLPWASSNSKDLSLPPWSQSPPYPPNSNLFLHGFPQNPLPQPGNHLPRNHPSGNQIPRKQFPFGDDGKLLGFHQKREPELIFGHSPIRDGVFNGNAVDNSGKEGSLLRIEPRKERGMGSGNMGFNGWDQDRQFASPVNSGSRRIGNYDNREQELRSGGWGMHRHDLHRSSPETWRSPPGFPTKSRGGGNWDSGNRGRNFEHNVGVGNDSSCELNRGLNENEKVISNRNRGNASSASGLSSQLDRPGPPAGSNLHSVRASDIEESMLDLHGEINPFGDKPSYGRQDKMKGDGGSVHDGGSSEMDDLGEQLIGSLLLEDGFDEKADVRQHPKPRDKDFRSDSRGQQLLSQRLRNFKRQSACRSDVERLNAPFLAIYESLIPADEEKAKQKQLLSLLEKLVSKEWPNARLYLYGSCASSFGVSKSDIDVCLAIDEPDLKKSEILLKLADILQSDNLQNVQALTRARVPIVKLMDPVTEISCDICINNVLAVVNTKLLRDYAQIDVRLRQLAFIVKHWAKSRGVNETYHGTLSSYAYVLMCIHFLQQRRPAILPCLQVMEPTYAVTVENIECSFFDRVEKLQNFGSHNRESIARLVWAFFNYWAYCHDYSNSVISIRTGSIISKRSKDWTRRIGNDRHLICIEDPFEVTHDLGRVVDKYSIKVLREEFERAADIMQHDPNPCVALFEPYLP